jgi:hypothetical protein
VPRKLKALSSNIITVKKKEREREEARKRGTRKLSPRQ